MMNKEIFSEKFKNKDYDSCLEMLRYEIIDILLERLKEKKPNYKYSTTSVLKNDCFEYLSPLEQNAAVQLYTFDFSENAEEFELSILLEIYKELTETKSED